MTRLLTTIAIALLLGCHNGGGPADPPHDPPDPPDPPDERVSLEQLRARQTQAAQRIRFSTHESYLFARRSAQIAKGHQWSMDGLTPNYWYGGLPLAIYHEGSPAEKEKVRQYFRRWLQLEKTADWRKSSMVHSLNHQISRNLNFAFAVQVLGEAQAMNHGDRNKVPRAEQIILDIIEGCHWYNPDGTIKADPADPPSAGRHPEGWRSRHYAPRIWMALWAAADYGSPAISTAAYAELDIMVRKLKESGGVQPNGLWNEAKLPHYRADTEGRCPCIEYGTECPGPCRQVVLSFGLTCHPGETQVINYILFPWTEWRPEFDGTDPRCGNFDMYQHWAEYIYLGGKKWRPLK